MMDSEPFFEKDSQMETFRRDTAFSLLGTLHHDLYGRLDGMKNLMQLLRHLLGRDDREQNRVTEVMNQIDLTLSVANEIANTYMELFRRDYVEAVDITNILRETVFTCGHQANKNGIRLKFKEEGGNATASVHSKWLFLSFLAVIRNAIEAIAAQREHSDGIVHISIETLDSTIAVTVRDNGPGIEPSLLGILFEPGFTTKPEGQGMGLHIARKVINAHGGSIRVNSIPGDGTEVILTVSR